MLWLGALFAPPAAAQINGAHSASAAEKAASYPVAAFLNAVKEGCSAVLGDNRAAALQQAGWNIFDEAQANKAYSYLAGRDKLLQTFIGSSGVQYDEKRTLYTKEIGGENFFLAAYDITAQDKQNRLTNGRCEMFDIEDIRTVDLLAIKAFVGRTEDREEIAADVIHLSWEEISGPEKQEFAGGTVNFYHHKNFEEPAPTDPPVGVYMQISSPLVTEILP